MMGDEAWKPPHVEVQAGNDSFLAKCKQVFLETGSCVSEPRPLSECFLGT